MNVIGTNIKNQRTKKNMTLKEVAKKCGVTESFLGDVESGKKIPNQQLINSLSKVFGIAVDALEPSYLSDYFEDSRMQEEPVQRKEPQKQVVITKSAESNYEGSTLSNAFSKATNKIPVLQKITPGKKFPFEGDIADHKLEPVFQGKGNNVKGDTFVYYIVSDNSMSGARILKNDLALVSVADSISDKDIVLALYGNKAYIRRYKTIEGAKVLLYPENPDYEVIVADKKEVQVIGKLVRVEFKI